MNLPDFHLARLDSGLQLASSRLPWARGATVGLLLETGSRDEAPGEEGSAHFIEHMLFKGTRHRPLPLDLTARIEALGGSINAWTNQECTAIELHGPATTLPELLDAALDMATGPRFEPDEFEREREVILEEIAGYHDDPAEACGDLLGQALWPGHALGHPIAGSEASIGNMDLDTLRRFHARRYRPERAVIAVAGNFDPARVVELVEAIDAPWPMGEPAEPGPRWATAPVRCLSDTRPSLSQRHVGLAWHGPSALDERRYAARFALAALAETMSSRLFQRLREERGLIYQLTEEMLTWRDTGAIQLYLEAEPQKMDEALDLLDAELIELASRGFTPAEVERARGYLLGQIEMSLDSTARLSHWLAESARLDRGTPQIERTIKAFRDLTVSDLAEEMSRWLAAGTARAEVGPASTSS